MGIGDFFAKLLRKGDAGDSMVTTEPVIPASPTPPAAAPVAPVAPPSAPVTDIPQPGVTEASPVRPAGSGEVSPTRTQTESVAGEKKPPTESAS